MIVKHPIDYSQGPAQPVIERAWQDRYRKRSESELKASLNRIERKLDELFARHQRRMDGGS